MARYEPSNLDILCLPLYYGFVTKTLSARMDLTEIRKFNSPIHKLRGERVKAMLKLKYTQRQ